MSKFDYMGFSYAGGRDDAFVVHAKKYTQEQAINLCKREYGRFFCKTNKHRKPWEKKFREPTINDINKASCAFRFGASVEYPEGCYTFVDDNANGAFPVYVILFSRLEVERTEK